jgi:RNA polymerase sigma factor (sigma-70 family)
MDPADIQTVSAAIAGDEPAFAALAERHRRELHVHCYRLLASFDEAEDAVQETFLKAWRGRESFAGGSQFRAWLYRIATNVCLDMLRQSSRWTAGKSPAEVPWIQPYPDVLLDQAAPAEEQPEAAAIRRETISLAFLTALQALPPRQRAALVARDVLGWPASETASVLGTSVAAANSALQRARATMADRLPPERAQWSAREPSAAERELLQQFIEAHERLDAEAARARSPPGTSASRCRPTRCASTAPRRSGRSWPKPPRWASGAWSRSRPTGCRPPPATCAGQATASSARSSWTSCGCTAMPSRRSPRSARSCSPRSAWHLRCSLSACWNMSRSPGT